MQNSIPLDGIRILSYFPWSFPDRTGAFRRFSSFVRWLSEAGAEVTLALTGRPSSENTDLGSIHYRYHDRFSVTNSIHSIYGALFRNPNLKGFSLDEISFITYHDPGYWGMDPATLQWFESLISMVDVVTWEYTFGVEAIAPICRKLGKPLIVTTHDHLSRLHAKHPMARMLLQEAELRALRLADARFTVSAEDRESFRALGIDTMVTVNVADTTLKKPGSSMESFVRQTLKLEDGPICIFVGSLHAPNQDAASQFLTISNLVPEAQFVLFGKCCPPYRRKNFLALGEIDDFLYDALHRSATLFLNPVRLGGGSSLKFFDALCYGKCILTTPVGARGHDIVPGTHAVVCNNIPEFVTAVRFLIHDEAARSAIGNSAREYACRHDVRREFSPYLPVFRKLVDKRPSHSVPAADRRVLFLVDNNLSNRVGHHFTYAETLAAGCRKRGIGFKALVKRECDMQIVGALSGIPVFSKSYHEPADGLPFTSDFSNLNNDWEMLESNLRNFSEMAPVLRQQASPGDVVFLPNAHYRQLLAVAMHIAEFSSALSPTFVCMLRYPLLQPGTDDAGEETLCIDIVTKHQLEKAFRELEKVASPSCLRLVTDSRLLAEEYQPLTCIPFEVLPIPHTADDSTPKDLFAELPARSAALRIVTLGDARKEKGFHLLPAIVRELSGRSIPIPWEFIVHGYVSHPCHASMQSTIDKLRGMDPAVTVIEHPLSSSEYRAILESADIVLLPYDERTYHSRTSGPFMEAVCAGKVVVVTDATWMTSEITDAPSCLHAKSDDAGSFADAICEAATTLTSRLRSAGLLATDIQKIHNPESFLDALMGAATAHGDTNELSRL